MTIDHAGMRMRFVAVAMIAAASLLGACASAPESTPPPPEPPRPAWFVAMTLEDRDRMARLPEAWENALSQARAAGFAQQLAGLGALADPRAALPDPAPPPGPYRCRTVKLGSPSNSLAFVAYGWFDCEVEPVGDLLRLDKLTGSQRQHGLLYEDTDHRLVFLGTLALGSDEGAPPAYRTGSDRNVVGVLERIGDRRWRLVQPWPHFESYLDLLELESR